MLSPIEQARRYLAKVDPAVSGQNGHGATYHVACLLVQDFGLSVSEAETLMTEYSGRCVPPWGPKEIAHKLQSAINANPPPQGRAWRIKKGIRHRFQNRQMEPAPVQPQPGVVRPAQPIIRSNYKLTDESNIELPLPVVDGTRELIKLAFQSGEGIRIVQARDKDGEPGELPKDSGLTLSREEWLRKLDANQGDINRILKSSKRNGIYVGMNPLCLGGSKDSDVTSFRHCLIEWDDISKVEQWNIIVQSRIPCTAVIDSGGDSIHAWVKLDAQSREEYNQRVKVIYDHFEASGCRSDEKNKNPSRLSRLAACERGDQRQELLTTNIGAKSFTEWVKWIEFGNLGECLTVTELADKDTNHDPNCVIGFRDGRTLRYLCRGKSAWLVGPSGIGKSSLSSQIQIAFALGRPLFGITPSGPLKSLVYQSENDAHDLAEMVQGVLRAAGIARDSEEFKLVDQNLIFDTDTTHTGQDFVDRLQRRIDRERPQLVWVDPMLSFMGVDASKQDDVTLFLRQMLNPVLEATGVVLIGIHHTGKPKKEKDQDQMTALEYSYAGLGSSELVNWARAVLTLVPLEVQGQFKLSLAKRGFRAGATHPNGQDAGLSIYLEHGKGSIYWQQIDPPEFKPRVAKGGRPSNVESVAAMNLYDVLSKIPIAGESASKLAKRLETFSRSKGATVGMTTAKTKLLDCLIANGKVRFDELLEVYHRGSNA